MDLVRFRHGLFPAVPVLFDREGRLAREAQAGYMRWMARQPIAGVAVWAHTGRGLKLDDPSRVAILRDWRAELPADKIVIVAAGASPDAIRPADVIASAVAMAHLAADNGADALLVHPPTRFRGLRDNDTLVLEYHAAIAGAGLPLILFYLYEAAGGVSYSPVALAQLLARPDVIGIKIATLDRIMTFQQIVALAREVAPTKIIFTGEDRFLGYSLMCGATAALIGMAAACTTLQAEFLQSYWNHDAQRFLALNKPIDDLAQHTFVSPMEGYIGRMLACLVVQGVLPAEFAIDPWGPRIGDQELAQIADCLARIGQLDVGKKQQ